MSDPSRRVQSMDVYIEGVLFLPPESSLQLQLVMIPCSTVTRTKCPCPCPNMKKHHFIHISEVNSLLILM